MRLTPKRSVGWVGRRLSLEAHDPTPYEDPPRFWRSATQAATIVICVLLIGIVLYLARVLLVPVLCALAVGLTVGPLVGWLQRHKCPPFVSAIALVLLLIGLANAAVVALAGPASSLVARAPELGAAFAEKLHFFDRALAALNDLQAALGINTSDKAFDFSPTQLISGIVTTITPVALQFVLQVLMFFATLFFLILGRSGFRTYTVHRFGSRSSRLRALKILNDIEETLGGYLVVVTIINFGVGCVTALAAAILGLPSPLLWGTLAFVLNYIPYVGPAVMDVLLFVIGLLTFPTLLGALVPPAVFMGITLIEGQFLTPAIVGRQVLSLPPLAIFLSIAFWAWLWGPVGAFLATPILIIARVALMHCYPKQRADLPG